MDEAKKEELTALSSCELFNDMSRSISSLERLWTNNSVVDVDVVDQAEEEGAWGQSTSNAKIQAFGSTFEAGHPTN